MADTQRTLAALQSLFADNTAGDISPQDLRDFLFTMKPPHGAFYRNVAAPTTISVAGTYYKAEGTTTSGSLYNMSMPADNRLTYTGTADRHFHIAVSLSMTSASSNQVVGINIAKNGTPITGSVCRRKIGTGSDLVAAALHADVMMSTNDYIELWVTNETSAATVTLDELYFFAMGMFE